MKLITQDVLNTDQLTLPCIHFILTRILRRLGELDFFLLKDIILTFLKAFYGSVLGKQTQFIFKAAACKIWSVKSLFRKD